MKASGTNKAFAVRWKKPAVLLFWLAVWSLAACLLNKPVLLPGPAETAKALAALAQTKDFWLSLLHSLLRIGAGFGLAFAAGLLLGSLAFALPLLDELLAPLLSLMQAAPIASFIILALIWTDSKTLVPVVVFPVVFPLIFRAVRDGLAAADPQLLEIAAVFHLPPVKTAWYIRRPAMAPYLLSACASALGMSWKAGVAAEVIGTPRLSLGEQLYLSKLSLATAELFAWTLVIVLLSAGFQKLLLRLMAGLAGKGGNAHGH